ncbi:MAG TPA: ABC transporter substrate-binding protein [Stellaceae bacterium]|nr:ABC transporter substrate-binding protein [Stellaceae bacterium]
MRRRDLLAALAGVAALAPAVARAQQKEMPVIGYLSIGTPESRRSFVDVFRRGLSENGYVEGRNVAIEYRWAEDKLDRFPALAAELVARNVDIIVTAGGTLAALAAKRATTTIPIVFAAVGDPVQEGLAASLARPGGNITGLSFFSPQLAGKRLEMLKEAVPGAALIAVLLKPDAMPDRARQARLKEVEESAGLLGVRLRIAEARSAEDFDRAFSEIAAAQAAAVSVFVTPLFISERRRIAELAARNRLPAVLRIQGIRRSRRLDVLRTEHSGFVSAHRRVRRQNTQWRQARRPSGRAADEVRAGDQPEDRQGARPHRAAIPPRPRRRGHRMRRHCTGKANRRARQ